MENKDTGAITPIEGFWPPRDIVGKASYLLSEGGGVTKKLISFLKEQTVSPIPIPHETGTFLPTFEAGLSYLKSEEIDFVKKHYPDGARYSPRLEKVRARAKVLEHAIREKDYLPLIRYFLDESLKYSEISKKQAARYKNLPEEERLRMEEQRKEAINNYETYLKTRDIDDIGFPPQVFEVSGIENAATSRLLFAYAICFAKAIK